MKAPYKSLFMFLMITSTLMLMSSSNWLVMWMSLEINMMGFIPLMYYNNTTHESEATVKYMVPQSIGSTLFIMGFTLSTYSNLMQTLIPIALCLKLGAAPLHFWFPPVMANLALIPAFLLLTWQKIAPILAISSLTQPMIKKLLLIAVITALWGSIGGLNQTDIRLLLTYSSIAHTGWMITSIMSPKPIMLLYLTTYILINLSIMMTLWTKNYKAHKMLLSQNHGEPFHTFMLSATILSLGGLPPLTGFIMKAMVVLYSEVKPMILAMLIMSATMSLYYYLTLMFSTVLQTSKTTFKYMNTTNKTLLSLFSLSQLLPLLLLLLFF
uniref:NADH-ubiquinone oxidoreductase chain 2 n=1 Tax=Echyridella menziesii TaxID=981778 RepID=A0A1X9JI73_9BIVA|nr:NADH dehydrogenase subunit 2 [Echyridella menziesii]AQT38529.1 NADH dehydrogenase subunit 2 [Echyridella menziesii]